MILPRPPRKGDPLDAEWGARLISYLRSITLRPGTNYRLQHTSNGTTLNIAPQGRGGGGASTPPPGPLQVSLARPPGGIAPWDDDEEPTIPLHVWTWWGLVGDKVPANIDGPVVIPATAGTYWLYVEADIDPTIVNSVVALEILAARIKVSAVDTVPTQTAPDPITGKPPEKGVYLLARVIVALVEGEMAISDLKNSGSGSIGAYVYTQDVFFRGPIAGVEADPEADPPVEGSDPVEAGVALLKNIAWYR